MVRVKSFYKYMLCIGRIWFYKWKFCKCAQKKGTIDLQRCFCKCAEVSVCMHDRYVCYVMFCIVDLCAIYVYSMFCVYVCTCMHVFVCVCPRYLALSYSRSLSSNHPIFALFPLSMRFLEWLVTSFSFSFIYILILSFLLVVYCDCF